MRINEKIEELKSEEMFERRRAAKALRKIGDKRAVEPLIKAIKSEKTKGTLDSKVTLDSFKRALKKLEEL